MQSNVPLFILVFNRYKMAASRYVQRMSNWIADLVCECGLTSLGKPGGNLLVSGIWERSSTYF
jgi:hypothetical protein